MRNYLCRNSATAIGLALVSYLSIELLVAQVTTIYGDKMMRLDVDMMSS